MIRVPKIIMQLIILVLMINCLTAGIAIGRFLADTGVHTMNARPYKLKDGSWGAIVEGQVQPGDAIKVVTRNGKQITKMVTGIVWSREGQCAVQCAEIVNVGEIYPHQWFEPSYDPYGLYGESAACYDDAFGDVGDR